METVQFDSRQNRENINMDSDRKADATEKNSAAPSQSHLKNRAQMNVDIVSDDTEKIAMSGILSEQVAVVTGAGRGIGKAIALALGEAGAHVVCLSRTLSDSVATADALKAMGEKAWAHAVDVSDSQAAQEIAATIVRDTGRVDILINNAGVTRDDLLMRMSEEAWDTVIDTNLKRVLLRCVRPSPVFHEQRQGCIVNIASSRGIDGHAQAKQTTPPAKPD